MLLAALAVAVGYLAMSHAALEALLLGLGAVVILTAGGRYLTRVGVLDLPLDRMSSVNLVARPPAGEPRVWLVDHLDSKSQTIPMLLRVAAVALFAVLFTVLLISCALIAMLEPHSSLERSLAHLAHYLSVAAAFSLIPLMACFIGNRSPGAGDNASGVAAVLLAAEALRDSQVGILITSAEELGLAGARAFARSNPRASIAINCDTVDSAGAFLCMRSGKASERLEAAIDRCLTRLGLATRSGRGGSTLRPMLPGVLADNVAFTDAGWESFTLSRGNLATLARVHTSRDVADSIDGTGIAQAALLMTAIVQELT